MREMNSSKTKRYRLSSFDMHKPGLLELLFKRSFVVGVSDYVFHIGIFGSIITGAIAEISNLIAGSAELFNGFGWLVSRLHGVTGIFLMLGGLGFVLRYFRNRSFRVAYGRIFYLDLAFMGIIAITGSLQALPVFGLMQFDSFSAYSLRWVGSLHVTIIYVWIIASLFAGGAIRQGAAAVVWRLTSPENKHRLALVFSDACGRCGRCVEACPLYEAMDGSDVEAPVLKLRKYFKMIATKSLPASEIKLIAEQTAACTMCGLCVGVCPFSFNFVDMYKELLAYANKIYPLSSVKPLISPGAA
jgi:ferredoxin